jgi:5-methylcytosine-specific restriction endonuclease McrA
MCGATGYMTRDHILPKGRGGSPGRHNQQPMCGPCNNAKGELWIDFRVEPPVWHDEGRLVTWTEAHTQALLAGSSLAEIRIVEN